MGHDDLDKNTKSGSLKETQILSQFATLETNTVLVGRFKVLSLQGCGRFGCVYKAKDLQLDSDVAIKVLHQHLVSDVSLRNFKNEILTLRQLSHPNIVRVHEYYESDDCHFITMDWIEGDTLSDWLKKHHPLTKATVSHLIEQLIQALTITESKGINHKDLKPENILIDEQQQLYIADFGIASAIGEKASSIISGTPLYSPPEYLESGKVTESIDIYAFGVILHELVKGETPYQAQTHEELIKEKYKQHKFQLTKEFSEYAQVIQACTAPIDTARPQSVENVRELLSAGDNDNNKSRTSLKPIFALVVLLVVGILGYIFYDSSADKGLNDIVSEGAVNAISLTILPFETEASNAEPWLTNGLPIFISNELSDAPNLRVIGYERSKETLDLLGYSQPLDDAKVKVISELTQSPYLLHTKVIAISPNKYQVSANLIEVSGRSIQNTPLLSFQSNKDEIAQSFSHLPKVISKRLGVTRIDDTENLPENINLKVLSKIEFLLGKGEISLAKTELSQLLKNTPNYARGWLQLGRLEASEGNILSAESSLQKALEKSSKNSLIRSMTQAELQLLSENIDGAIKTYQDILKELPNNHEIRFNLAQLLIEQQSFEEAEIELNVIVKNDENHPQAWYELAKVSIWQGNTQEAVDNYLVKALVTAKKLKDKQLEGDVLNAFGVAYHRLGQLEDSLDYYQQGLGYREAVNDARGVVTSLSNLAAVYAVKGEYELAEESLLKALEVNKIRNDAVKQADLYNELGIIAEEQGDYKKALDHFRASLSIRMKLEDDWLKAESLNNVAYIFFLLSDEEKATIYWEQAKAYYEKVDDPVGIVRVNENMAQLELQKGNWQKAYQMYKSALDKANELNLLEEAIVSKAYLAKIAFLQSNFEQPLQELLQIKEELKERQDVRGQVEFSLWLADWSLFSGNYEQATAVLKDMAPLMEQENNRSQQLIYDTHNDRLGLYSGRDLAPPEDKSLNNITSKAALEHLIYKLEYAVLSAGSEKDKQTAFDTASQQFESYDLDLHKFYRLRKLILAGFYYAQHNDVGALESNLNQLVLLNRGMGTYWRSYQIDRLQSIYYEMNNKKDEAINSSKSAINKLLELQKQLPEKQQQHFISLQGRYFKNDKMMEQLDDKQ
ncbi:hypothetical protein GCM10009123_19470 [Kangiella japonica]|uniref:non-specific serine/threonine protein kinase n=1 Tax=Kangiella japonica TaxID=647384 RepID=A0ABN0T4H0_9GAMM